MEQIVQIVSTVPTWVWILAIVLICVPTIFYAIKRSIKILLYIGIAATMLFMFPSIGSAVLESTGMTWDAETGKLTNSEGQSVTLKLPSKDDIDTIQKILNTGNKLNAERISDLLLTLDAKELQSMSKSDFANLIKEKVGISLTDAQAKKLYNLIVK